jgi:hypothetical protein
MHIQILKSFGISSMEVAKRMLINYTAHNFGLLTVLNLPRKCEWVCGDARQSCVPMASNKSWCDPPTEYSGIARAMGKDQFYFCT